MKNYFKITAFVLAILMLISAFATGTVSAAQTAEDREEKFVKLLLDKEYMSENEYKQDGISYSELFSYYKNSEDATNDEATPDYILIKAHSVWGMESYIFVILGDRYLNATYFSIDSTGYVIYVPSEDHFYGLIEAYNMKLEGIEAVFDEYGVGRQLGDVDRDGKLTVKDATFIQKCVAGICKFELSDEFYLLTDKYYDAPVSYVSDYNRDGERNVKDATAIQKHIAGLK